MFILTEKDIEYCQVTACESPLEAVHLGINYRGFLFFQVGSYNKNQWRKAIENCRKFLEKKEPVASIIVENQQNITLWCENKELHVILPKPDLPEEENHSSVVNPNIKYRGQTIDCKTKKQIPSSEIAEQIVTKKVVMKYRGQEIVREVKQKITPSQINQRKMLKYRSENY